MVKNLVIVESPAKAKTIEGYLGAEFTVKSSFGHIRDLPEKDLSIDIENDFAPKYVVPADKKKLVGELQSLAKKAEVVWLATDEDREGEAISWHLKETLGLDDHRTRRITFNEITKTAILKAIEKPRSIDYQLVNAQQARRVLDRLVGYELSPVLWKKVKPSLSAGRVQSVAVRLIVEREREIQGFQSESAFRVVAEFTAGKQKFKAELSKRFNTIEEARKFLNDAIGKDFKVLSLEKKPGKKSPSAPFTTSTLQQEASRKLGFSVSRTMSVAQALYEAGKISYMRTDSVSLSDTAMGQAKSAIVNEYGDEYAFPRKFSTKSKGAQEAHEAIRPTDMGLKNVGMDAAAQKLYDLILKRTIASQMADAKIEKTIIKIGASGLQYDFVATGEVIRFDGFLKVYTESTDEDDLEGDDEQGRLPDVKEGEVLGCDRISATERFSQHPPRYTEASLVKKLEELGIGRPSTYAPTISTIVKRNYVEKGDRPAVQRKFSELVLEQGKIAEQTKTENTGAEKAKLFPTDIGAVVTDFLSEHFSRIMDYHFTAKVEQQFDDIAEGKTDWTSMLQGFYKPFHANIDEAMKVSQKAKGERELGVDPASGKMVIAKIGRFGPLVQIGDVTDEEKPKFASIPRDKSIATITLAEALKLFELPRTLGVSNGQEVIANTGKFGPYVKLGSTFASLPKDISPMDVTLEQALQIIVEKETAKANAVIKTFPERKDIQVLNGRYGPYIKVGKDNIKIPKGTDAATLSLDECVALAEKQLAEGKPKKRKK
jgi:DNA topoisomerase I